MCPPVSWSSECVLVVRATYRSRDQTRSAPPPRASAHERPASTLTSWGRPSTRSATMLRCTSPVPPPMVSAWEYRYPLYQLRSWRSDSGVSGLSAHAVGPGVAEHARSPAETVAAGHQAPGSDQVPRRAHHVLAVLVGQDLAHAGLRAGLLALQAGGQRPEPDELQHRVLGVEMGQALASDGIGDRARGAYGVEQVERRRSRAPQHAARGERDALVAERHLGQPPAVVDVADEVRRGDPHVGEEHLVEAGYPGHGRDRPDLDAREIHRADQVRDALVLGHIGIGAGDQNAEAGELGATRPDLLTVDHPFVPVEHGARAEAGQIRARPGLAEELAPDLLARQHRQEVAPLLLLGAGEDEGGPRPADADGIDRSAYAGALQLVVDDELVDRVGTEPVGRRPVRRDETRLGQVARARIGMLGEP